MLGAAPLVMEETTDEAAADYLKRNSVTLIMHDLLAVLLENRPADPIEFISDYFDHVAQDDGGNPIERACRYIQLSKPGTHTVHHGDSHIALPRVPALRQWRHCCT